MECFTILFTIQIPNYIPELVHSEYFKWSQVQHAQIPQQIKLLQKQKKKAKEKKNNQPKTIH